MTCSIWALMRLYRHWNPVRLTVLSPVCPSHPNDKKFDFSDPYFDSGVVMGIAESNNDIKSYEDLKGKKVAVKRGTEGFDFAESIKDKYGFGQLYSIPPMQCAWMLRLATA